MLKSYYDVLEISSCASRDEIKKQFKKLAKLYHPDLNSSLEAENIFKEINKAAEILLDEDKRKKYDELRSLNKATYKSYTNPRKSEYTFSDLFKATKKEEKKVELKPQKGGDIVLEVEIDYIEAVLGTQRSVNIARSALCPKCLGHKFANNKKCPYCGGLGEKTVNKKITVRIPKGLKNGAKLRIRGEGKEGKNGGENGNLYIIVNIEKQEDLKIKDDIVYYDAQISPYMAILGGNIQVPTLWGQATMKIPPLTKANQSFKLVDVGVLNNKTNKKGDQIVKIIIQIPNDVTAQEIALYEKIKDLNMKKINAKTNN